MMYEHTGTELVAGLDLGTTFFKVGLYDCEGRCHGHARQAFGKDLPNATRCDIPVAQFRSILKRTLDEAVAAASCRLADIMGVSYASQANSFLLLDEQDTPLTPIIIWRDGRAAPLKEDLKAFWSQPQSIETTGLGLFGAEWMAAKLDWFRREQPAIWSRCRKVLTLSDYLALLITGHYVGDAGTASLLGLWDLRRNRYYGSALELLQLDEDQLPGLYRPGSLTLPVHASCHEWLGLRGGIPFTLGALDHHTAALGAGIGVRAGVSVSFGTSLTCFRLMEDYAPRPGCCLGPLTETDGYYQISFCSPGTSAMDQYKQEHASQMPYETFLASARSVSDMHGMQADIADGRLQFTGATRSHRMGHYVRAIMELSGRNIASLLDDLGMDGTFHADPTILAVGGGARSELWMDVVAEVAGLKIVRACPPDTASKGAAMLSAVGVGWFKDVNACATQWNKGE